MPERTRHDVARLLSIRHAGIAIALAALAPLISSNLYSTIDSARLQGTAAVLDAPSRPRTRSRSPPTCSAASAPTIPRGELQKSIKKAQSRLSTRTSPSELGQLVETLDDVVTGAVRRAFRPTFIVTAATGAARRADPALGCPGGGGPDVGRSQPQGAAAVAAAAGYGIAFAATDQVAVPIRDPCKDRQLPDAGWINRFRSRTSRSPPSTAPPAASAPAARSCSWRSSTTTFEHEFEQKHHVDPRSITLAWPGTARALIHIRSSRERNSRPAGRSSRRSSRTPRTRRARDHGWPARDGPGGPRVPFKPELATIGQVVHGGVIGALIDTAAMAAAWATDEVPESVAGRRSPSQSTSPRRRARSTCVPRPASPSGAGGSASAR